MSNIDRELQLEEESIGLGIKRYRDSRMPWSNTDKSGTPESELPPGIVQLRKAIVPMAEGIKEWVGILGKRGYANRFALIRPIVEEMNPDVLSFITCKAVINSVHERKTVQQLALRIAQMIVDERNYSKFEEQAPGFAYVVNKNLKDSTSQRHSANVVRHAMSQADIDIFELTTPDRIKLGTALLEIFIQKVGLVEIILTNVRKNKTVNVVVATEEMAAWFEKAHSRCELLAPMYMPMLSKPAEWSTPFNGGYLNRRLLPLRLVKTRNKGYLDTLREWDMPLVYDAVNALQNTPWRISRKVLEVMRQVWDGGLSLGNLPMREDMPLPTKPVDIATNEVARKEWKRAAAPIHAANQRLRGKRVAMSQKLWLAEKFVDEEAIYFPHVLDWRGRIYPVPSLVTPQADDSGKALLEFSKGKKLGENGAYWLAVHIAGLFGVDKVSLDERVEWVIEHDAEICMAAIDPLQYQFWTTADKPYQALAACFEWDGYQREGDDFVSHIPVAMDGSNNGVQHFAMAMRDVRSGEAVNLVPSDKPQDIYQRVANVVAARVELDAADSVEYAAEWIGKVSRKICKRPVMTLPYGATRYGMKDQVAEEVRKQQEKGEDFGLSDLNKSSQYLAGMIYDSIGEVVSAARQAMDWLQEVARTIAKAELPVKWITPVGFPVLQEYRKAKMKTIKLTIAGARIEMKYGEEGAKLDKKRQALGISPNTVHSWDAAHLVSTVNMCLEADMEDFAMVHDSYAVHACDVELLNHYIRKAFVLQYEEDRLEDYRRQLIDQLPEELAEKIPPVPEKGDLDPELVMKSQYFFA